MSTTLMISHNEMGQLEPQTILVESRPVEDSRKLSANTESIKTQVLTWEDFRGVF
ncbi:hypothetical protein [Candidatus Nitrosopumilus sp. SW]|uniref:hypothetical protein n=1 Tax=Candidatus Nitrosopumilus sp. SW TaxID=2508726 RepID=UPI00163A7A8B|nr:hypothetical protein [Candidatus Nitrosopumilus sp. SW]